MLFVTWRKSIAHRVRSYGQALSRRQTRSIRKIHHAHPLDPQRRQRHAAVAGLAQEPAQAVPGIGRQGHAVPV